MKNKVVLMLIAAAILAVSSHAGENKRGEAGFMFLKVPVGAREASLGWSGLTMTSGASAIYWNPANVSALDRSSFVFSRTQYFAGIESNYGAFAIPVSDIGVFGVSLNYLSYGSIPITTEAEPNGTGATFSPFDVAFAMTYSKQVTDRVSGGLTFKVLNSKIHTVNATGFAFDFGFSYATGYRGLKMGFAITNVGPQGRYDGDGLLQRIELPAEADPTANEEVVYFKYGSEPFELPATVAFGASMDLFRNDQNSVVGSIEQNVNSYQADRTNLGLEYGFKNMVFARFGYTSALKRDRDFRTGKAATAGLTFGAGVDYKMTDNLGFTVDYGYVDMGPLNAVHRFSVGMRF